MHVNSKQIALSGLLLAFTVILLILSGMFEFNTLFLLGAASFMIGIVIREYGLFMGTCFFIASIFLGFILAPNKFYCITLGAMELYLLIIEFAWKKMTKSSLKLPFNALFYIIKYISFNIIYLPLIIFAPKLIYSGEISPTLFIIIIVGGQVVLFIYDKAYEYFQCHVWGKIRRHFMN